MSWVTVLWAMVAAVCLTLAGLHLLVWCRQRAALGNLLFAFTAVGVAGMAGCELWMMQSETPGEWGAAGRWMHLPTWVAVLSLVGFVHVYLRAGRLWLAWTVCGLRTLSLVLNFIFTPNLNYREITGLRPISFLGETVVVAEGVANPWMALGQLSLALLVVFVLDATLAVWRRGDHRRAILVGASTVLFVLLATVQAVLALWGFLPMPITASLFYLGIAAGMAFELSDDTLRAAGLARELAETEKRMNLAAEAAKLGIWIRDFERHEIWASDRWRDLLGFAPTEELQIELILSRLHPEDREPIRRALAQAIDGGGHYEREYRVVLPDGRLRWIDSRGRVEFDHGGKPVLARGVSVDITERKRAEAELHERRGELAHLSRVTMLGELSGSLAHELNQPLTAILSNAQAAQRYLAKDPPNLAEVREILADIVSEDERAGEVIRRLRLLLKKGEVQQRVLDANEVVLEVLKLVRSDLASHGVTVETQLAPDLAATFGDRVQLQQVLLNLVMNACDAMAGNEARDRHLTLRTRPAGDGEVRIEVSDVGCGLPDGDPERVFERYYTTKLHGLGLGLSVCRTIITAHGGMLGAMNNPERGATFFCQLGKGPPP